MKRCTDVNCRCQMSDRYSDGWRVTNHNQARESYHGTYGHYVKGCRCAECRAASAAYQRARRAKARA